MLVFSIVLSSTSIVFCLVRDKSKQVIDLVSDTELLRSEREKARLNRYNIIPFHHPVVQIVFYFCCCRIFDFLLCKRDRFVGIGAHGEMSGHIGELGGYGNTDLGYTTRHPEYPQTGSTE